MSDAHPSRARHERHPAGRGRAVGVASRTVVRDWLRALRLPQHPHAAARAHRAVRARHRRGDRHRREGDVHLRRRAERREPDAAPGRHCLLVRAAIEHNLLYNGPTALWYYAGRCSATSGRRRAATAQFHQFGVEALGFAGPGHRCRTDPDVRALWRELGLERHPAGAEYARLDAQERAALPRATWCATSRRTRTRSTPTPSAACTAIRCACSTARTRRCRR